jgi:hypothetical protein
MVASAVTVQRVGWTAAGLSKNLGSHVGLAAAKSAGTTWPANQSAAHSLPFFPFNVIAAATSKGLDAVLPNAAPNSLRASTCEPREVNDAGPSFRYDRMPCKPTRR